MEYMYYSMFKKNSITEMSYYIFALSDYDPLKVSFDVSHFGKKAIV